MAESDSTRVSMVHLELVEEFPKNPVLTQFEKILVAARRAKDLHDHDKIEFVNTHFTSAYTALQELKEGMILPAYREEDEPAALLEDDSEDAEEDE